MKLFETMLVALIILLTIAMVLCMRAEKAHSAGLLCYGGNSSVACTLSDAPPEQLLVKWREISPEPSARAAGGTGARAPIEGARR